MTESEKELLRRFLEDEYSPEEYQHIQELLRMPEVQEAMEGITRKEWETKSVRYVAPENLLSNWSTRLKAKIKRSENRKYITLGNYGRIPLKYAAVFIGLALLAGIPLYLFKNNPDGPNQAQLEETSISPGSDKALLTLADGSVMSLSDAEVGTIALQGGLEIEKKEDGSILYRIQSKQKPQEMVYNTITTPRGGQYRVTLPDGSNVLLNAASSLTYPVYFSDKERQVSMTGEAYFEIVKWKGSKGQKSVPFIVNTEKQKVEVLGTRFNINAYTDENAVETSLVEGSVRVTSSIHGNTVMLSPGQKSILAGELVVETADIQKQVAWTNDKFIFKEESLGNVMRQISRWYDLDIDCPPNLEKRKLTGIVARKTAIEDLIATIATISKVNITTKGRRLIVSE